VSKKVAIIVDWENVRKGIFEKAATRRRNSVRVNYNNADNVIKLVTSFVDRDEEIYRIFFYLSRPVSSVNLDGKKLDYSDKPAYTFAVKFIEEVCQKDLVAVRQGTLKFRGLKDDGHPDFVQKQVDMLIGLDIAHLAYNRLVDRIMVFTYDTDIVPALKTARINGLQVIMAYCPDLTFLDHEIQEHSDFIRQRKFTEIFPQKTKQKK